MEALYFLLGIGFQSIPFVAAFLAALFVIFFCLVTYSRPASALWFGGGAYFMKLLIGDGGFSLGLNLSVVDLYFMALSLTLGARLLTGKLAEGGSLMRAWLLIGCVWGLSFAVGLVKFKTAAGVEFRNSYYMLALMLYLLSFRLDAEQIRRAFNALYALAWALIILALLRWAELAAGVPGYWYDRGTPLRVLTSGPTFVIALAALPGLSMWMKLSAPRALQQTLAPFMLLAVLVLGHRTVWIATLAGLGAAWWLAGRRRSGVRSGVMVPLLVGGLALGAVFVLAPKSAVTQEFQRSVAETQSQKSTLNWRFDSWQSLVKDWAASGPAVWPAGKPFGSGYRRYIETQRAETEASAHSQYVSLLVRGGLLVLVAYVASYWIAVRRLLQHGAQAPGWLGADLPAVFLAACLVYSIAYSLDFMNMAFVGLAFVIALQTRPQSPQAAPTHKS